MLHRVCYVLSSVLVILLFLWVSVPAADLNQEEGVRSKVTAILKSYILKTTPWKESEIEIRSIGKLRGIEFPSDGAELRLGLGATLVGRRNILASIEEVKGGKALRSFWITADLSVRASILTASRKIPFEKVIASDDVAAAVVEIPDLRAAYARIPEDLVGKTSRRGFSPGDPLTRDAFAEPFLVRHGETVRLRLERNGIVMMLLAKAEQDGRLGQVITVRNLDFSSALKAQVTGRASVRIQ